jgi:site-specific DNA-methyltransferase (adenine-specific)
VQRKHKGIYALPEMRVSQKTLEVLIMLELNKLYLMDCMEGMAQFPDGYFELAIVDPPYGYTHDIVHGNCSKTTIRNFGDKNVAPEPEYFKELFRVSKNQIIWGGNYFLLPPSRCFVVWRKTTVAETFSMAMCEYAWASFNDNAKWIELRPGGTSNNPRIHPTQKPIALYNWLLKHYAKPGDKILDTHVGSASSLIACHKAGHDFIGFELDPDYHAAASERLECEKMQLNLFANCPK